MAEEMNLNLKYTNPKVKHPEGYSAMLFFSSALQNIWVDMSAKSYSKAHLVHSVLLWDNTVQ